MEFYETLWWIGGYIYIYMRYMRYMISRYVHLFSSCFLGRYMIIRGFLSALPDLRFYGFDTGALTVGFWKCAEDARGWQQRCLAADLTHELSKNGPAEAAGPAGVVLNCEKNDHSGM